MDVPATGTNAGPILRRIRLDRRRQWRKVTDTWYNADVRTQLYRLATPIRWLRRLAPWRHTPSHA